MEKYDITSTVKGVLDKRSHTTRSYKVDGEAAAWKPDVQPSKGIPVEGG